MSLHVAGRARPPARGPWSCLVLLALLVTSTAAEAAPYRTNLLKNPDAETGDLSGWTLTANGGEGWAVSSAAGSRVFRTSFAWNRRVQVVDLHEQGFSPQALAKAPVILVSEQFQRHYCPDQYYLKVELLDANMAVVESWDSGVRTNTGACQWGGEQWDTLAHEFRDYDPGVRYVRWEDGGKGSEGWSGHYGVMLDKASLEVLDDNHPAYYSNLLKNPGAETGDLSGWTLTANGAEGWAVSNAAGSRVFRTSFDWNRRVQVVDLWEHGFSPAAMAKAPLILASEQFQRHYCPDSYYLKVELLDASMAVVASWNSGVKTNTGACQWGGEQWDELHHVFTDYGPNVRYVRWEDGGKDAEGWSGHYGVMLDNATLLILSENLLDNPGVETGDLSGWTVTANGGAGWRVDVSARDGIPGNRALRTSYDWLRRSQLVDLRARGIPEGTLDTAPAIYVAEQFRREYCPDQYYMKVELLDANMAVLTSWNSGVRTNSGACEWGGEQWDTLTHVFTDYGPGVRYVRWEDGGKDAEGWGAHYGAYLDGAYLGVHDLSPHAPHREQQRSVEPASTASLTAQKASSCGGDGQAPCDEQTYSNWCYVPILGNFICPFTMDTEKKCNKGNVLEGAVCRANSIDCCKQVNYSDWVGASRYTVSKGYSARVHLASATLVIPPRNPAVCSGTYLNQVMSVGPNDPAVMGNLISDSWSRTYPNVRLMINANFFDVNGVHPYRDRCTNALGTSISNTALVSNAGTVHGYATETLVFYTPSYASKKGHHADILTGITAPDSTKYQNAVSGYRLVKDKKYVPQPPAIDPDCARPRAAAGLTRDKHELVVIVVNGGNDDGCNANGNTTLKGLADYLIHLGVENAVTLDGSGSAQLLYRGHGQTVSSLPSDSLGGYPGKFFRPVPVFLGIQ
ncbi:phosphodiester glycosidase family protein [Pyxidicoccus sp. 3LFB2]